MQGPPLTPSEITAILDRAVRRLEDLGIDRAAAIPVVARRYSTTPERVAVLLGLELARAISPELSPERLSHTGQ